MMQPCTYVPYRGRGDFGNGMPVIQYNTIGSCERGDRKALQSSHPSLLSPDLSSLIAEGVITKGQHALWNVLEPEDANLE